jgi:hypothetical protein
MQYHVHLTFAFRTLSDRKTSRLRLVRFVYGFVDLLPENDLLSLELPGLHDQNRFFF